MKTILVDAAETFVVDRSIYEPIYDLLQAYPNRKIILTNANDEQMIEFGLTNMPYEIFTLKHNPDKTDPVYFKTMLAQFGLNADDVVYFEHSSDAVKSAKSVGIIAHHYDAKKKDIPALKAFLDTNL
jgi:HAD superfamily hydrolase (TIGR01509 family)